jgi:hypothetical protein
MQEKNEISDELKLLSTVIDSISRQAPYEVPGGYFDGFPDRLLDLIQLESAVSPFILKESIKSPVFSVPEGYFDRFPQELLDKIKAGKGGMKQAEGHGLGQDKQDGTAADELAAISPLLGRIGKKMPFQVPEGYFDIPLWSPVLAGLANKPVYQAPEGYFDTLADHILLKVKKREGGSQPSAVKRTIPGKLVSMNPRGSWWKYSAAAVVGGFMLTLGWLHYHPAVNTLGGGAPDISKGLSKVSDQEIENYLDNHNIPLAESVMNSTAVLEINDNDIKDMLGDVPDGELKSYMDEHGGAKDPATN